VHVYSISSRNTDETNMFDCYNLNWYIYKM